MNLLILGGSGFVGRAVCTKLVADGHRVTVATRVRDHARALFPLPSLTVIEADVHDAATLAKLAVGQDALINLVGTLNGDFERVHVALTRNALDACRAAGVRRYLHMSALGASLDGPSDYLKSRATAEALVRESGLDTTIFAPSVIFGREDSFLNRFATLVRMTPPLSPFALPGASTRMQPVWVDDVARAVVAALSTPATIGQRYELAGPKVYSLRELVRYVMTLAEDRHPIIGLPDGVSMLLATLMSLMPGELLTRDNVRSLRVDNVSNADWPAFAGRRAALEDVAPTYLGRVAAYDAFADARERAGRLS